jgi:hypothetical protein
MTFALDAAWAQDVRPKRKGRKYKVRIDSAPQRASIYLDDEKYGIVGYTPWEGRLEKGDWKVIVKLKGYSEATRVVRVKRTYKTQEFFLPMEKKVMPGVLDMTAAADQNAFGAEVWVDGQLQGTIPVSISVKEGRHLVEVKKSEFQDYSQWVDLKEGQTVTVGPVLKPLKKEPKKGSILVDADVQDAEVYVDGTKQKDKTPTLISDVVEGAHVVEVRKDPSMPWKQTVTVKAGQTVKVHAELQATIGGPGGSIRVLCNTPGAEVFLDGTLMGKPPLDIKDVKPGVHVIEVRAPGYQPKKERLEVSAGSADVREFELNKEASGERGTVKIVSTVPEAEVSIDGERIGAAPQTKDMSTGEHFVVVEKAGYKTFKQKVRVEAGQAVTVTAELKAVGIIRVLSTPAGSTVSLDGEAVGKTPFTIDDVGVGEHVITVSRNDYYNYEKTLQIEGGKREVLNATLKRIDLGPTAAELEREQRGRSSFSARTLDREKPTVDLSAGYPHFFEVRFNIGVGRLKGFGMDAGIALKTFFQRTDLSVTTRIQFIDKSPFALGVFGTAGYGTRFDRSQRDTYFLDAGGVMSLTAVGRLTISGRFYLATWTDRFCPSVSGGNFEARSDPTDLCKDLLAGTLDPAKVSRIQELLEDDTDCSTGNCKAFDRNGGLRPMASLIIEYAMNQRINIWGMIDGTPLQDERPAYTDAFNGILFEDDNGVYFRGGATFKF